ncbi:MAG: hypothetical protein KGH93_02160 [Patescibacteria group bacterium]|nr:hypothetical protein [Patescibacteria group bacterium]MDE1945981.1 hypothetical protein [Patescibacteria group bacterium]
MKKTLVVVLKCIWMLGKPFPAVGAACALWYYVFFVNGLYISVNIEIIMIWISTFGILYGLMEAVILTTVWSEYKQMRTAVKRYDFDTFADLRDEEVSPLVHTLTFVLSGAILLAFMCLPYASVQSGFLLIGSTTYLFVLVFLVIYEIDDPCTGLWYIRSIPKEWLEVDVKKFRHEERYQKAHPIFLERRKMARRYDDPDYEPTSHEN